MGAPNSSKALPACETTYVLRMPEHDRIMLCVDAEDRQYVNVILTTEQALDLAQSLVEAARSVLAAKFTS